MPHSASAKKRHKQNLRNRERNRAAKSELKSHVRKVLSAIDADVIKTYVELGLGVGIVASMAYEAKRDRNLRAIEASHLFRSSTTRVAIRRGTFLRGYTYAFIELFASQLTKNVIDKSMAGEADQYDL